MDVAIQILASGLTLGAMYAVASLGLSLVYGALNMLNMAHGAILTFGGYMAYAGLSILGLPAPLAFLLAIAVSALAGLLIFFVAALPLLRAPGFETNIFIATIGLGSVIESLMLKTFGPYPIPQPLIVPGDVVIGAVHVPNQNLFILAVALVLLACMALLLERSQLGRAIRATAQNRVAAQLMGVRVASVYAGVLALSGGLAAVSGIMVSSLATLTPVMGGDPMLKAFIVCVVAGLGNAWGAAVAALALGLLEAAAQYIFGVRWSFAFLLLIVILVLVWRPQGLFGREEARRL